MRRLLVTGGSGNLGRPLSALASAGWETTATYFRNPQIGGGTAVQLDLRRQQDVFALIRGLKPDVVIHTAASERSVDMEITNNLVAQHIAEATLASGVRLVALSTDLVFDGRNPPYSEDSPHTATSPYGRVKAQNERLFVESHPDCLVVRTSLIYDRTEKNSQIRWLRNKIEQGESVPLFVDEIRQPIWSENLSQILLELAETAETGLINVAGPKAISRWEFGCALLRAMGYEPSEVAHPAYASQIAPKRPRNCTLTLDKARAILSARVLSVDEALRQPNRVWT